MKAIVRVSGSQYQVTPGMTLKVNGQLGEAGNTIDLPVLLCWDADNMKIGSEAKSCKVTARIESVTKGKKIDVMRFRHKVRHRRHIGYRPFVTTLLVDKIHA